MAHEQSSVDIESNRLEAFSDGVLAVVITIMVLELHAPEGGSLSELWKSDVVATFLAYLLSFTFVGIYWNNHHHLLRAAKRISGAVMWSNLHLLFWLSMIPFVTSWVGEHVDAPGPAVAYGVVGIMAAMAYTILVAAIAKANSDTHFSDALGHDLKGMISLVLYFAGTGAAFIHPYIAYGLYAVVSIMWFIPDRRLISTTK